MKRLSHTARVAGLLGALCATGLATPSRAQAPVFPPIPVAPDAVPDPAVDRVTPFVGYQYTYDDNLFRLPSSLADYLNKPGHASNSPRPIVRRSLNTGSAGVDGHWVISQQSIDYGSGRSTRTASCATRISTIRRGRQGDVELVVRERSDRTTGRELHAQSGGIQRLVLFFARHHRSPGIFRQRPLPDRTALGGLWIAGRFVYQESRRGPGVQRFGFENR